MTKYFLRVVLGWSVDIMIDSFFIPTRQESHEHVTVSQYTDSTIYLPTSFDHRAAIFDRASSV